MLVKIGVLDVIIKHGIKIFAIYNQWQKLWEKLLLGQFRVSPPFPLLTMLRNNEQNLRQAMLWVCNIV